jgi:hypothetical protein
VETSDWIAYMAAPSPMGYPPISKPQRICLEDNGHIFKLVDFVIENFIRLVEPWLVATLVI